MAVVKAGPNEFLLVGRGGRLENRGSAVQAFLMPGTVWILVPSGKHEARFEFTQETRDGIPLRFKGIVIYRIADPVAAARQFDFRSEATLPEIDRLLADVCLGELRDAVSHMTMAECIEGRKTTLSGVVRAALHGAIDGDDSGREPWGITVEVAQLAQAFIVDADLRRQLESEVRNEIRLRSEGSDLQAREQSRLSELSSESRVAEQKLAADRETLRREEELEATQVARERRRRIEDLATERQAIELERERLHAQLAADRDRIDAEAPVRRHRIETEAAVLREELDLRRIQNEVKALEVDGSLLMPRAQQDLRREILPLEQAPQIVAAASKVLNGASLSIFGEDGRLVGQLAPVFEALGRAVALASAGRPERTPTDAGS